MTKEERHLWYDFLKAFPCRVKRQKPIGPYIADFYIPACRLIIELDGSEHFEEEHAKKDAERDTFLRSLGLEVVRYTNADIRILFEDVCQDIWKKLPEDYQV